MSFITQNTSGERRYFSGAFRVGTGASEAFEILAWTWCLTPSAMFLVSMRIFTYLDGFTGIVTSFYFSTDFRGAYNRHRI